MENKDFTFEDGKGAASGCTACPLSRIPARVWERLLRPPFRKRHPIIAILGALVVCGLLVCIGAGIASEDGETGDRIALVDVKGMIVDSQPLLDWIETIAQEPEIKGVLVRVNSPGGGAGASSEIYSALAGMKGKKPIAVSMGATAASGGLMVSMAGDRIFADKATITGSIGVRMDIPQIGQLLNKLGVGAETLVTGPYKDAGSMMRPLSDEDRKYLDGILKDMHAQFVDIVATGRHMERSQVEKLATGRIFTGREALEVGLIDEIGGMNTAHAWLCEQTGVSVKHPLQRVPAKGNWMDRQLAAACRLVIGELSSLTGTAQTPAFLNLMKP